MLNETLDALQGLQDASAKRHQPLPSSLRGHPASAVSCTGSSKSRSFNSSKHSIWGGRNSGLAAGDQSVRSIGAPVARMTPASVSRPTQDRTVSATSLEDG